jgi:membrane associated rhomboid family serine protease
MFPLRDDNPKSITPIVTIGIIIVNVLVFFYQLSLGAKGGRIFIYQYGAIPAVITGGETLPQQLQAIPVQLTIFTSMFLHGGWAHLIGNMWYLWIFGDNVEEAMGHFRYLIFYLISGLLASMSHIISGTGSVLPSIGASGAISGVLGAYLLLYPRAQILTFIFLGFFIRLIYIPAGFVLGFWFVLQLLGGSMAGGQDAGGVAFWAHIGGFVAGLVLVNLFRKRALRVFAE